MRQFLWDCIPWIISATCNNETSSKSLLCDLDANSFLSQWNENARPEAGSLEFTYPRLV